MLIELFWNFLQVGLFSVGGGLVSITLLMQKVVEQKGWLTATAFNDLIAIAESTPGPIAVNAATFVGMQLAGIPGMLIATLGAILPGCAIVIALATLYKRYRKLALVQGVMDGLRPVIVASVFVGGFSIMRTALFASGLIHLSKVDWLAVLLFITGLILQHRTKISAVALIVGTGVVGCAIRLLLGM